MTLKRFGEVVGIGAIIGFVILLFVLVAEDTARRNALKTYRLILNEGSVLIECSEIRDSSPCSECWREGEMRGRICQSHSLVREQITAPEAAPSEPAPEPTPSSHQRTVEVRP